MNYLANTFFSALLTGVNFFALFKLLETIQKLFASDESDIVGTLAAIVVIFSSLPIWHLSQKILNCDTQETSSPFISPRALYAFANAAFLAITLLLCLALPMFSDWNFEKGQKAHAQKNIKKAIYYYEKASYQQPMRSDVYFALGNLYESIAKFGLAKENYWLAIKNDSTHFEAYNNLAHLYLKEGKYDDALDLLELALHSNTPQSSPNSTQSFSERAGIIYKNIAWAYLELQEYKAALKNIELSFDALYEGRVVDRHPIIQCIIAIATKELGQNDKAKIAQQVCSENAQSYSGIERALERRSRQTAKVPLDKP